MKTFKYLPIAVALASLASGCEDPDDGLFHGMSAATLATQEDAEEWSNFSGPMILLIQPLFLSPLDFDEMQQVFSGQTTCPAATETGSEIVVEGDCTDEHGREWRGRWTLNYLDVPNVALSTGFAAMPMPVTSAKWENFGITNGTAFCDGAEHPLSLIFDGELRIAIEPGNLLAFSSDLIVRGSGAALADWGDTESEKCELFPADTVLLAQNYKGEVLLQQLTEEEEFEAFLHSTWNGEGRVGIHDFGWAQVESNNQLIDIESCELLPTSGQLTVRSQGDTLDIHYAGSSECEMNTKSDWHLNGEQKGKIMVNCSVSSGSSWAGMMLILALGIALVRRRSSVAL